MVATLRQTKAELSRMVRLATRGEEIVITVRGVPVAKLTGIPRAPSERTRKKWLSELNALRERSSGGRYGLTAEQILAEDRAEDDA